MKQLLCKNCGRKKECGFEVYVGSLVYCKKKVKIVALKPIIKQ